MPRPRYTITINDLYSAKSYLIRKGYSRTPGRGVEPIDEIRPVKVLDLATSSLTY